MKIKLAFACLMGFITTGIISFALISINVGFGKTFFVVWIKTWCMSYLPAVFSILIIGPWVQTLITSVFRKER